MQNVNQRTINHPTDGFSDMDGDGDDGNEWHFA